MELRHLRYFVAVADALNFTKTAAKLSVAQPALSRQVLDLEDEIGVDLLQRSPRGVALTAEGKLFLDEARKILEWTDEAIAETRALARGEFGELHIGYHQLLARVFAPASPPPIAIECDSASSLITEVESGRGGAVLPQVFSRVFGKRLRLRPLTPEPAPFEAGIVRAVKGDVTPAGERFCQQLRAIAGK